MRAPSAIQCASQPASCTTWRPTPLPSQPTLRIALALGQRRAGGHLGDDEAGAQRCGKPAERRIGDAGHRRQKHAVRQRDRPDRQRLAAKSADLQACSIAMPTI